MSEGSRSAPRSADRRYHVPVEWMLDNDLALFGQRTQRRRRARSAQRRRRQEQGSRSASAGAAARSQGGQRSSDRARGAATGRSSDSAATRNRGRDDAARSRSDERPKTNPGQRGRGDRAGDRAARQPDKNQPGRGAPDRDRAAGRQNPAAAVAPENARAGKTRADQNRAGKTRADQGGADQGRADRQRSQQIDRDTKRAGEKRSRKQRSHQRSGGDARQDTKGNSAAKDAAKKNKRRDAGKAKAKADKAQAKKDKHRQPDRGVAADKASRAAKSSRADKARRSDADYVVTDGQLLSIAALTFGVFLVIVFGVGQGPLGPISALILGVVEGITEYLPVSSTGHLLVAEQLLGIGGPEYKQATDTYTVAIQIGAILAVLGVYRKRIASILSGFVGRDAAGLQLGLKLLVAFVPGAAIGYLLADQIKEQLFGIWPVVGAWAVGGVFLLIWKPKPGRTSLGEITFVQAAVIGTAQVLALWPGTSRSLATIVAAILIGLSMSAAVEFSFLLGLMTLSAATIYDLTSNGSELVDTFGFVTPLIGILSAAVTASIAVRWFVAYLRTKPLQVFGWYRIVIALITAGLVLAGVISA